MHKSRQFSASSAFLEPILSCDHGIPFSDELMWEQQQQQQQHQAVLAAFIRGLRCYRSQEHVGSHTFTRQNARGRRPAAGWELQPAGMNHFSVYYYVQVPPGVWYNSLDYSYSTWTIPIQTETNTPSSQLPL